MTPKLFPRTVVGVAGALAAIIGSAVLFIPESFIMSNGIALPRDPGLLNEIRAPGALLAASGILAIILAIRNVLVDIAAAGAALLYGAYGAGRLVGYLADGHPGSGLVAAMGIELAVAALCLWAFDRARKARPA